MCVCVYVCVCMLTCVCVYLYAYLCVCGLILKGDSSQPRTNVRECQSLILNHAHYAISYDQVSTAQTQDTLQLPAHHCSSGRHHHPSPAAAVADTITPLQLQQWPSPSSLSSASLQQRPSPSSLSSCSSDRHHQLVERTA